MIVTINKLDSKGRGIVKDKKPIFVDNALIDEVVDIEITKQVSKYALAKVVKYIKTSPKRIKPICPYFGKCGGCQLMHLSYQDQLLYKEDKVKEIVYKQIGNIKINNIVPSKEIYYRNKVTFHVQNNKIGFYKLQSKNIIEIKKCYLLKKEINDELENVLNKKYQNNYSLVIRSGIDKLIINQPDLEETKDYVIDEINGFKFILSPTSFFQVNTKEASKLYNIVKKYLNLNSNDTVLDLYCGTGTIGLTLSKTCKYVYGVEINKQAINDANQNKKLNNISNISFTCLDAKDINSLNLKVNKVVVDPPRAGLDKKTIKYLNDNKFDTVVYVSCDMMTLVRDIKLLQDNYTICEITPVDMFPQTYHIECVCLLKKISV